ncbi:NmrA domain-containing protein [Mycena indigotica]|uniref:NmrA domain-containing protein n=1 Tax=Mycena indigotica TaxID=2126181 RepID=A0A8H6TI55_9AGAR|nr:NmrA domain-containing protein [Mycena indigotica]KAF7316165.1 NmrA domain-containing protein [Mycena indigotica]
MPTFLVTAATGRQGQSTAQILLASGAQINALVRDPTAPQSVALQKLGARLFKGSLKDAAAVAAATEGVSAVFLNTFPDFENPLGELPQAENAIAAAKAAGTVQSIVASTVVGANDVDDWTTIAGEFPFLARYYTSKSSVERAVRDSGFQYTILRPGMLFHNFIGDAVRFSFPDYPKERVLTVSYPAEYRLQQFDAADVGQVAAKALLDPRGFAGREIDLHHEPLTFKEIAQRLSAAAGTEIKVRYRSEEETREATKTLPALEVQVWWPRSNKSDTTELQKLGLRLTTFEEFLEREKVALRKTLNLE